MLVTPTPGPAAVVLRMLQQTLGHLKWSKSFINICLLGMSKVEVKRFLRKRKEYLTEKAQECDANKEKSSASTVTSTSHQTLTFEGIEFERPSNKNTRPWEQTKYGWIPNPKRDRAKFMTEVLTKFYEACHGKCKDARDFVKLFHCKGGRQYESHQHVSKISATVDAILSNRNPGAGGKFFDE